MKQFKGTKGPWTVTTLTDESFSEVASSTYHQISSERNYFDTKSNTGFGLAGFMSEHDASLIAAAPDLLEALQSLLVAVENIGGEHVTGLDILEEQTALACAAIDKALGE